MTDDLLLFPDADEADLSNPFGAEFDVPEPDTSGKFVPTFDRWGRYDNLPPVPGYEKVKGFTRVSTLSSTLEDKRLLHLWQLRQALIGAAKDPSILDKIGYSDEGIFYHRINPNTKKGKDRLNALAEEAQRLAGSKEGADAGTERHDVIEGIQRGTLDVSQLSGEMRTWYDGYEAEMLRTGLKVVHELVERFVVIPQIGCAGRFDMVVDDHGILRIGDLKSQKTLIFGQMSLAAQLSQYANAAYILDEESRTWKPMPKLDRSMGVIIWAPAERPGLCEVHEVDLDFGVEIAKESRKVRTWRYKKGILTKRS